MWTHHVNSKENIEFAPFISPFDYKPLLITNQTINSTRIFIKKCSSKKWVDKVKPRITTVRIMSSWFPFKDQKQTKIDKKKTYFEEFGYLLTLRICKSLLSTLERLIWTLFVSKLENILVNLIMFYFFSFFSSLVCWIIFWNKSV